MVDDSRDTDAAPGSTTGVAGAIIDAALALIASEGFDRLSVRRLATTSHYSPSAISYHVTPIEQFATRVWFELHQRTAVVYTRAALAAHPTANGSGDWAEHAATAWLEWAEANPRLAAFYVGFTPDLDHVEITASRWGLSPQQWARGGDELRNEWWYFIRRMQASLELALRSRPGSRRVQKLADDMGRNAADWLESLSTYRVDAPADDD